MSQENVEIVRAAQQQFARGDLNGIEVAENFELVTPRENPDGGTYQGEAARRWLEAWLESFDEVTVESTEMIDAGDDVFAGIVQRGRPRGSRAVVEERSWQVVTVRDGAVTRIQAFLERAQALEAAGLKEYPRMSRSCDVFMRLISTAMTSCASCIRRLSSIPASVHRTSACDTSA
jgi:ketosteroid isomerase-like protein